MPPRITVFGTPEQVVSSVLEAPGLAPADVAARLATLPRPTARRLLVDRLEHGGVVTGAEDRFLTAFRVLGTGGSGGRIQRIAMDMRFPPAVRRLALATLGQQDDLDGEEAPEDLQAALEENLANLVRLTLVDAGAAQGLAGLLELLEPDMQEAMADIAEGIRRTEGIPAPRVWGASLRRPSLVTLRGTVLDAMVGEGGRDAVTLLEGLRDAAPTPGERSQFQSALLRLCTAAADPDRPTTGGARGDAWVSSCDGQGDFNVMASLRAGQGRRTFAALCIRAGGEVRDGFVVPEQSTEEVEAFLQEFAEASGVSFTRVPLTLAASLVEEARVVGLAAGRPLPPEAEAPLSLLERVRGPTPEPTGPVAPVDADASVLLEHPAYASWTVELADLGPDAAPPPRRAREIVREAWIRSTAANLDGPENRARLATSCAFMARWHTWAGEPSFAGLAATAAALAADDLGDHPLVLGMLRRSYRRLGRERDLGGQPFGDPTLRGALRNRHFADVTAPRGRDLAVLDLAEVTVGLLTLMWARLPARERPAPDVLERAAVAAARAFTAGLHGALGRARRPATACILPVAEALMREGGLREERAEALSRELFTALYGFFEGVCGRCPARCHWRPNAAVGPAFFDDLHPAFR